MLLSHKYHEHFCIIIQGIDESLEMASFEILRKQKRGWLLSQSSTSSSGRSTTEKMHCSASVRRTFSISSRQTFTVILSLLVLKSFLRYVPDLESCLRCINCATYFHLDQGVQVDLEVRVDRLA